MLCKDEEGRCPLAFTEPVSSRGQASVAIKPVWPLMAHALRSLLRSVMTTPLQLRVSNEIMKLRLELLANNDDSVQTQPFLSPRSTTLPHPFTTHVKHNMRKSPGNRSAAKGPRNQHKHTFENKREREIVRKMRPMGPPPLLPTLEPWEIIVRTKPQRH
jgi:hypothetical protein